MGAFEQTRRGFALSHYRFPEVMDYRAAPQIAKALNALKGADLIIDGSQVSRLSTRGAEVCLAAQAQWKVDGHKLHFASWSAPAREALERLGLFSKLIQEA